MISASLRAEFIDGTSSIGLVEVEAVAVGQSAQSEDRCLGMKMLDNTFFLKSFCDFLGRLFQFKGIDQLHPDKVLAIYFNRQAAAGTHALFAETWLIFYPGIEVVCIMGDIYCHDIFSL